MAEKNTSILEQIAGLNDTSIFTILTMIAVLITIATLFFSSYAFLRKIIVRDTDETVNYKKQIREFSLTMATLAVIASVVLAIIFLSLNIQAAVTITSLLLAGFYKLALAVFVVCAGLKFWSEEFDLFDFVTICIMTLIMAGYSSLLLFLGNTNFVLGSIILIFSVCILALTIIDKIVMIPGSRSRKSFAWLYDKVFGTSGGPKFISAAGATKVSTSPLSASGLSKPLSSQNKVWLMLIYLLFIASILVLFLLADNQWASSNIIISNPESVLRSSP